MANINILGLSAAGAFADAHYFVVANGDQYLKRGTFSQLKTWINTLSPSFLGVTSKGSFGNQVVLNTLADGQQSGITFQQNGATKWLLGNAGDNSFFLYNSASDIASWQVSADGLVVSIIAGIPSTSPTTGALRVPNGGIGTGGAINAAGSISSIGSFLSAKADTSGLLILNRDNASLRKASIVFQQQGSNIWEVGTDINGANAQNFYFYDNVNGAARFQIGTNYISAGADNASSCGTSGVRWSTVYAATGTINTSDQRTKDILGNLSDVLERARQIKVVEYDRYSDASKAGAKTREFGVIAQDVRGYFPTMVYGDEATDILGITESKVGVIALAAVQELAAKVDALTARASA